jgi:hypothetical protein
MITPFQTDQTAIDNAFLNVRTDDDLIKCLRDLYEAHPDAIILWIGGRTQNVTVFTVLYWGGVPQITNATKTLIFPFGCRQAFQITKEQASSDEIETRNTADIINELYVIYGYYPTAIILSINQNEQTGEFFITFFKNTLGNLAYPENNILYTV